MTGGVCLIGFGTVLTVWRYNVEADCDAVRKHSSVVEERGEEEDEEEIHWKEGERINAW